MTEIQLPFLPDRTKKPRQSGITMIMDKGLSTRESADFIEVSGHLADFVNLGSELRWSPKGSGRR